MLLFEGVDGLLVGLTEGAVGLTEGAWGLTEANKRGRKANAVRTRLEVEDTKGGIRVGAGALDARNALRAGALGKDAAARCTRILDSIALVRPLNANA